MTPIEARFYVGIGSNLGDRRATLESAIEALAGLDGLRLGRRSQIWETRPIGPGSGPFLNAAVELLGVADPRELLDQLLRIEREHGRLRRERWGDRTLDLDLLCGDVAGRELLVEVEGLTLPHPELRGRDFVLQPLADIDPSLMVGGQSVGQWLARLGDAQRSILRLDP